MICWNCGARGVGAVNGKPLGHANDKSLGQCGLKTPKVHGQFERSDRCGGLVWPGCRLIRGGGGTVVGPGVYALAPVTLV
jgi:hypothetical protein